MEKKIFCRYKGDKSLGSISLSLLEAQKKVWFELKEAHELLNHCPIRPLEVDTIPFVIQLNPQRRKSTLAESEHLSFKNRSCFLCTENLPSRQQGILYGNDFLILCNPAPLSRAHFTIAHTKHVPQKIKGYLSTFLFLAQDFGPDFVVFYNGPKVGASAPGHLHFQAILGKDLPEILSLDLIPKKIVIERSGVTVGHLLDRMRPTLWLESNDGGKTAFTLGKILSLLRDLSVQEGEAPMNLLCRYNRKWQILLYPRLNHRPSIFYREKDEERILLTPGAVEMAGLIILPRVEDFDRVTEEVLRAVFRDVALDEERFAKVLSRLGNAL